MAHIFHSSFFIFNLHGGTLPVTGHVAAAESKVVTARYEGRSASSREWDIEALATFVEDETHRTLPVAQDRLTAVKVGLSPVDLPPKNPSPNRHIMGINEKVNFVVSPASVPIEWRSDQFPIENVLSYFHCPWTGGVYTVSAQFGEERLDMPIDVVEPEVECRGATWNDELDASAVVGESENPSLSS